MHADTQISAALPGLLSAVHSQPQARIGGSAIIFAVAQCNDSVSHETVRFPNTRFDFLDLDRHDALRGSCRERILHSLGWCIAIAYTLLSQSNKHGLLRPGFSCTRTTVRRTRKP
jgi:hypothetical protein